MLNVLHANHRCISTGSHVETRSIIDLVKANDVDGVIAIWDSMTDVNAIIPYMSVELFKRLVDLPEQGNISLTWSIVQCTHAIGDNTVLLDYITEYSDVCDRLRNLRIAKP